MPKNDFELKYYLCSDHCCPFIDTTKSLSQIAATTHKRDIEWGFLNVEIISRRQHFAFIDKINLKLL